MGLSNSRMRSRNSRPRVNRSSSSSLSSFLLCGASSSSRSSIQMEDHYEITHEVQNPMLELSPGLNIGSGTNSGNCFESGLRTIGDSNRNGSSRGSSNNRASSSSSTLFKDRQSSDTVSLDVSANANVSNGLDDSVSVENLDSQVTFRPHERESLEEESTPGLGILLSNRSETARPDGSILQVDVLSISPASSPSSNVFPSNGNNAERNSREARRNGRRMFWDAFSRRSSRRLADSPAILFSMDDHEDVGSRDGWVFGFSGDFFDDVNRSDSGYLGSSRIRYSNDRRRHSRSEVWERLRSGFDESGRRATFCPSGIHPDGSCSCESLLINEESNTRASISRIVMLAEALFEVLDEIHRQPVSLSLSMVSSPAPASVVDSFPLKSHSKIDKGKSCEDITECYICLAEYEEGDKIRVLPCHHEYHMACVDKWLKEIHGVCPLCRGDVREGLTECSV